MSWLSGQVFMSQIKKQTEKYVIVKLKDKKTSVFISPKCFIVLPTFNRKGVKLVKENKYPVFQSQKNSEGRLENVKVGELTGVELYCKMCIHPNYFKAYAEQIQEEEEEYNFFEGECPFNENKRKTKEKVDENYELQSMFL